MRAPSFPRAVSPWMLLPAVAVTLAVAGAHPEFRVRVNYVTVNLSTPVEEMLGTVFVPVGDVCKAVGARWEHDAGGQRLIVRRGERRREIPLRRSRGGAFRRDKWFLADCQALAKALAGSVIYKRGEREVIFVVPTSGG